VSKILDLLFGALAFWSNVQKRSGDDELTAVHKYWQRWRVVSGVAIIVATLFLVFLFSTGPEPGGAVGVQLLTVELYRRLGLATSVALFLACGSLALGWLRVCWLQREQERN
jgi:hypothetical protein